MVFQESVGERGEYDHLMQWLDSADDTLTIVDRPVHDLQQEYQVCGTASFANSLSFHGCLTHFIQLPLLIFHNISFVLSVCYLF